MTRQADVTPTISETDELPSATPPPTETVQPAPGPTSFDGDPPFVGTDMAPFAAFPLSGTVYDQTAFPDTTPPTGICAQDYELALDQFDVEAADDFTILAPDRGWTISAVEVSGFYRGVGDRPATGVNVRVYRDDDGLPGALIREETNALPESGLESGSFLIRLSSPLSLERGHY